MRFVENVDFYNKHFHHVSTDEVYGDLGLESAPFTENTAYAPRSPYAASKASEFEFGGNDINFVPEYTANLAAHIQLPWNIYMLWEVQGIGPHWLDEKNSVKQDAYALINGRIGYKNDNWELFAYWRNLGDESYVNNALDLRYGDPSNLRGSIVEIPGRPRMVGVGLSASF